MGLSIQQCEWNLFFVLPSSEADEIVCVTHVHTGSTIFLVAAVIKAVSSISMVVVFL